MDEGLSLRHSRWEFKYHIEFIPMSRHKESRIEVGHLMVDHVHMLISIPPKYAVSSVVGYIKGKSAIHIAHSGDRGQ